MVEFNNPRQKVIRDSSNDFSSYIDKLNRQHPTKKAELGEQYNYGMAMSAKELRQQQHDQLHKQLDALKKEQKEQMREIRDKQRAMKKGIPDNFI